MTSPSGRRLSYCTTCLAAWHRNNRYLTKYGITAADYDRMFAEQGGVCAICGAEEEGRGYGYLHVDHCHTSSKVRGLLCFSCNAGIGHFEDDTDRLRSAIAYLNGIK
ncbi:endonuclease VII domain-containing protein [Rhodococcus sp. C1]|nr:endonuclease VII domain-containing protein [Rhodococcus sp. C1]